MLIKHRWGVLPEQMKFEGAPGFIKFALGENVKQSNWGIPEGTPNMRFPQTRMGVEQDLFFISMAARMLGMHPQTLRKYERLGLVQPTRTIGSMRLYSREELERLRLIKRLVDDAGARS